MEDQGVIVVGGVATPTIASSSNSGINSVTDASSDERSGSNSGGDIPLKSKATYEKAYKAFLDFAQPNGQPEEDDFILYFDHLRQEKNLASSTLWSVYSALNSVFQRKSGQRLQDWPRIRPLLKSYEAGYVRKTARTFSQSEVQLFLQTAPNGPFWILRKAASVMSFCGGLRIDELNKITFNDVKETADGYVVKRHRSKQVGEKKESEFLIPYDRENASACMAIQVKSYIEALKDASIKPVETDKFWRGTNKGRKFSTQPMGKNLIYQIGRDVAEFLNLEHPEMYSIHFWRQSAATQAAEKEATAADVKIIFGGQQKNTAMGYMNKNYNQTCPTETTMKKGVASAYKVQSKFSVDDTVRSISKIVAALDLFHFQVDSWFILQRKRFDSNIQDEPYQAIQLLFNIENGQYLVRVWGKTKLKATCESLDELTQLCKVCFYKTLPCAGLLDLSLCKGQSNYITAHYPFPRKVSKHCELIYQAQDVLTASELLGIGLCSECTPKGQTETGPLTDPNPQEDTNPYEDPTLQEDPTPQPDPLYQPELEEIVVEPLVIKVEEEEEKDVDEEEFTIVDEANSDDFTYGGENTEEASGNDFMYGNENMEEDEPGAYIIEEKGEDDEDGMEEGTGDNRRKKQQPLTNYLKDRLKDSRHEIVNGRRVFLCSLCGTSYKNVKFLYHHMSRIHLFEEFRCSSEGCHFVADFPTPILEHQADKHPGNQLANCPICKLQVIIQAEDFVQHVQKCIQQQQKGLVRKSYKKAQKCKICDGIFPSNYHLKEHMQTHTGEKSHKCNECDFATSYKSSLNSHKKIHLRSKVAKDGAQEGASTSTSEGQSDVQLFYPCDICGKNYFSASEVRRHVRCVHMKIKDKKCDECGMAFARTDQHRRHYETVHAKNPKDKKSFPELVGQRGRKRGQKFTQYKFQCDLCGRRCGNSYNLKTHLRTHQTLSFDESIIEKSEETR